LVSTETKVLASSETCPLVPWSALASVEASRLAPQVRIEFRELFASAEAEPGMPVLTGSHYWEILTLPKISLGLKALSTSPEEVMLSSDSVRVL